MGDFLKVSVGAAVAVLVAGLAGQAREVRAPSGTFELERKIPLDCYIDNNHMLNVGSVHAIRKGTRIWFVAKLENAGPYARSILLPSDIPPHLYVTIFNLPLLDIWGDCQAWWIRLPVVAPGR